MGEDKSPYVDLGLWAGVTKHLEHVKWMKYNKSLAWMDHLKVHLKARNEVHIISGVLVCCFLNKFHFFQSQFSPRVVSHFLFTSDLFLFQLLISIYSSTSSQFCHTTDLLVSFFLHFSNISSGLLLILALIHLVSGPVREPVELICLFRS